jgi:hypothetical protein
MNRREHIHLPAGSPITAARANLVAILAIDLGEMLGVVPISCLPLGEPSRCPVRPVQVLAGARPRVNGVEDVSGEGIEVGGCFCKQSATHKNSMGTCFLLSRNAGAVLQNRQGAGAFLP